MRYGQIRIPEDELFKHCKKALLNFFNLCTAKRILKPTFSQHLENEQRYCKKIADLKSLRSDNSVVEFWRKSEMVDFLT